MNTLFWGTEVGKMVSHQMHPLYCFGPKIIFASVLEHSSTFRCETMQTLCLERKCIILEYRSCENHFLRNVSILIPWTYIDVWECFRAFWKAFECKNCKTCVSSMNALFWVPEFGKWFCTKCIHCTALDPKWFLRVFWNIRQPSTCEKMQTLCFGRKSTISRYRNCENHFPPNAFSLIPWTNNDVCECL
jgi:hypothetical protein